MDGQNCYHCGNDCDSVRVQFDDKDFCCNGCKTVYEIFSDNDLSYYYELQSAAGATPQLSGGKYDFLEKEAIVERLTEFRSDKHQIVTLFIPHIHCSSCIWVLENLHRLQASVCSSQVDFPKKTVRIVYKSDCLSLKELVCLLAGIGYAPYISLEDFDKKKKGVNRSLIYKLGVAGFAFGNVMFLSFPEYLDLASSAESGGEVWLNQYETVFRWLMFTFSVPVVLYAGSDYFVTAWKGLRNRMLNIDVPIAIGILALFLRSTAEIVFDWGNGFFDSLTGLVFFLLLGRFFQQKTYSFLSFERDYKSYFPIAATRITAEGKEENTPVQHIEPGDRLLVRNDELIPADGILIRGSGHLDYSFVTGESETVQKAAGDKVYAGGKQLHGAIEIEVLSSVSQSHLTKLWGNSVFQTDKAGKFQTLTDRIGKRFTIAVLTIATSAAAFWMYFDPGMAINVFTAVLIIACPCAIALAAPFTLGNMLRIFGRKKFFLRGTYAIEQLSQIDTAIFDKTGTITTTKKGKAYYEGMPLTPEEESLLRNTLRASNHPLSRKIYEMLSEQNIITLDEFEESLGRGITGAKGDKRIKIGSAEYAGNQHSGDILDTSVFVSSNDGYKGKYVFQNQYREGLKEIFRSMSGTLNLAILSGDNAGEKERLEQLLPKNSTLLFHQKPEDKLEFIKGLQARKKKVLMVGDGLNDAGALAQADAGIAISEDINVFSPACDGILDASKFRDLPRYILASRHAVKIIKLCFILSLLYNVIGLYFAVTGQLRPVIAAILMPLSSISVVAFAVLMTNILGRRLK